MYIYTYIHVCVCVCVCVCVYIYTHKIVLNCWFLNIKCLPNSLHSLSPLLMIAGFDIIFVCG